MAQNPVVSLGPQARLVPGSHEPLNTRYLTLSFIAFGDILFILSIFTTGDAMGGLSARVVALKLSFLLAGIMLCMIGVVMFYDEDKPLYASLLKEFSAIAMAVLIIEGVFFIVETIAQREEREKLINEIIDGFSSRVGIDLSKKDNALVLANYRGVRRVLRTFDTNDVQGLVEASVQLDILNTWLPGESLHRMISIMLRREGGRVRLLLADRTSDYVRARSESLGYEVAESILECYKILQHRYGRHHEWGASGAVIELRLYRDAPPCSIFASGDEMFIGLFGIDKLAIDSFQIQFRSSSEIGGQIRPMFELLWERSGPSIDLTQPITQWGYTDEA